MPFLASHSQGASSLYCLVIWEEKFHWAGLWEMRVDYSFILLNAHLFHYLLITHYVPGTAIGTGDRAVSQPNKGSAFTGLRFQWRWSPSSLWRPLIQAYPRSATMLDMDLQLPPICPALSHCREPERLCNLPSATNQLLSQTAKIWWFLLNNDSGVRTPRMRA